jgi:hypothetical protein
MLESGDTEEGLTCRGIAKYHCLSDAVHLAHGLLAVLA